MPEDTKLINVIDFLVEEATGGMCLFPDLTKESQEIISKKARQILDIINEK